MDEEAPNVYRCPFPGCSEHSSAAQGWLQRRALVAHINTVHLSLPGVSLPSEFEQTVKLCPRCRLIVTSRGCQACQGKNGRGSQAPVVQMDVDASPRNPRENLPSLSDSFTTKVPVMQHVPNGFRIDWCDLLADEVNHFCEAQSVDAFTLLSMLPKVILLVTDRGGRRAKRQVLNVCRARTKAWKEQEWHLLWNKAMEKKLKMDRKSSPKPNEAAKAEKLRDRVLRLMADKGVSKAAREVISDGVHQIDQEILEKLRQLHPHEAAHGLEGDADGCQWPGLTQEDDDLIREVVKQFSDASGGGPTQMLPVHLKQAITCGSDVVELKLVHALRRFVDLCASGSLPMELPMEHPNLSLPLTSSR